MINSFSIYRDYYDLITLLSEREQQELLLAIVKYMFEDVEPSLNDKQMKVFKNLKRPLDKSKTKSQNKTNSNQNQNEIETKSNSNQNEIETKSKLNRNEIEMKSNENQTAVGKENEIKSNSNQTEIKTKTHQDVPVTVNVNVDVKDSFSYLEEQFGRTLSPVEYKLISKWRSWFSYDIINYAIDKTIKNGARALSYTEAIINSWHDKGFKTLRECELEDKSRSMKEHMPEAYKDVKSIRASDDEVKKLEEALSEID